MFRQLINVVTDFGGDFAKSLLWIAFLVLAGCVVMLSNRTIREKIRGSGSEGTVGTLWGAAANLFRALVGLGLMGLLCLHLVAQSREFDRLHGRVSEANLAAVRLIWGRPHVQRELSVNHYYETVEVTSETYDASGENVINQKKQTVTKLWPQNSIQAADVRVGIAMNYRRKGSAYYTCYESANAFRYDVVNFADIPTEARFVFPLQSDQGLIENLRVAVDGVELGKELSYESSRIEWKMPMQPQQTATVEVSYNCRGMDYYYYQMPTLREIRSFAMTMDLAGVDTSQLDYPYGCMTPMKITPITSGGKPGTRLEWHLDRALTTRGMGVTLPDKKQPGYHVARLLRQSPLGLMLLVVMLLVTRIYTDKPIELVPLAMMALAYYLFYTLMANLSDYGPGFTGSFLIAFLLLGGLVAAMQFRWDGRGFVTYATVGFFGFFTLIYPLIQVWREHTGLLLNLVYVLLLAYAAVLAIRHRIRATSDATNG